MIGQICSMIWLGNKTKCKNGFQKGRREKGRMRKVGIIKVRIRDVSTGPLTWGIIRQIIGCASSGLRLADPMISW